MHDNESYIDREFVSPILAKETLAHLTKNPEAKFDLNLGFFKTKEYTGRKQIIFELIEA